MKKLLYTLIFLASSSLVITACTEEEVTPKAEQTFNGGGNGIGDKLGK
jgi:hypothetical protein